MSNENFAWNPFYNLLLEREILSLGDHDDPQLQEDW
eukprot:CAMPEP_0182938960 /NCGR_PEP_ID=MMETSP0105_2-20130417/44824_1 /TAXON_ID=81532 ORGANISM="Acanthoeca-like sp., Strain 10tr" /NCGR_SAMPLE_ID=MMETSP0105_2 /ASSEMBLY_ACC=CAM_ASM_000205 /LENGTH=35 /DNA_ID= /DNA_START= /DNA_END= /DNA_ORIENTATION=